MTWEGNKSQITRTTPNNGVTIPKMETGAEFTLAEVTRLYQECESKLKLQMEKIKLYAVLLGLQRHGHQASLWRRKKRDAEDEYCRIQRTSSILNKEIEQLNAKTHGAQRLWEGELPQRALSTADRIRDITANECYWNASSSKNQATSFFG